MIYTENYKFEPIPDDVLLVRNAQLIADDKEEEDAEKEAKKAHNKETRKEKANEKVTCQCGDSYAVNYKAHHEKTKKHRFFEYLRILLK